MSRIAFNARSFVAAVLFALLALSASAPLSVATAEVVQPFWDERPKLTGRAPRAAKRLRESGDVQAEAKRRSKGQRYAARGDHDYDPRPSRRSLTGGVSWSAPSGCLNGTLASVVQEIAGRYGSVTVTSTCRSRSRNAAVGGARRSHHLTGDAVDFRVHGNVSGALAYLRNHGSIGGIKNYGGGLLHADTGPRRSW